MGRTPRQLRVSAVLLAVVLVAGQAERAGPAAPQWKLTIDASPSLAAADWKAIEVPGSWESRGLTAFDGIVWFTRQVDWPADRKSAATVRFGRIGNIAEMGVLI